MINPADNAEYADELRLIALRLLQDATDALEDADGSIDPAEVVSVLFSATATAFRLAMDTWDASAEDALHQWQMLTAAVAFEIVEKGAQEKVVLH